MPGGYVDFNDASVKEAAIRELKEEAGLRIADCEYTGNESLFVVRSPKEMNASIFERRTTPEETIKYGIATLDPLTNKYVVVGERNAHFRGGTPSQLDVVFTERKVQLALDHVVPNSAGRAHAGGGIPKRT